MTIQEKKQAIIEKVTNSNSDEFITLLYYNINKEIKWDETDEGKNLINILLEKSQQEAREGKTITNEEMKIKIKERFENRKVILK